MKNLIEKYINKLTKDDIVKFAKKNNLKYTNTELEFVYNYIKENYKQVLDNPDSFNISNYKNIFSTDNYLFINSLFNKYKKMLK